MSETMDTCSVRYNVIQQNPFFAKYFCQQDLLRIPELAINPLGDRIIHAFFFDNEDDKLEFKVLVQDASSSYPLIQDFVNVLSFFRPVSRKSWKNLKNTKKDKLMFSFRMYDLDNDGSISVVS